MEETEYQRCKRLAAEWRAVDPIGTTVIERYLKDARDSAKDDDIERMLTAYGELKDIREIS